MCGRVCVFVCVCACVLGAPELTGDHHLQAYTQGSHAQHAMPVGLLRMQGG